MCFHVSLPAVLDPLACECLKRRMDDAMKRGFLRAWESVMQSMDFYDICALNVLLLETSMR